MEPHLNLTEVLDRLKISKSYFYKLISAEQMPSPRKVGRRSFWFQSEVDTAFDKLAKITKSHE